MHEALDVEPTEPDKEPQTAILDGLQIRKRPKPGERRIQILQALGAMLEKPGGERITTAALASRLQVSEAALYRHFASKAQMFEGLIEFIEQSVFTLINQISEHDDGGVAPTGRRQAAQMATMLVQFAEKNPGLARVMVGDALVLENERLQQRMNQFFDKVEAALRQSLRLGSESDSDASARAAVQVQAGVLAAFLVGRLQRFVRSGFKHSPSDNLEPSLALLLG
jgi:TetR/AcrR family transcriptional regulator